MPTAVAAFKTLRNVRNRRAIHFDPTTDTKDREYALDAVRNLNEIIAEQFGTSAPAPFMTAISCYLPIGKSNLNASAIWNEVDTSAAVQWL